MKFGTGTINYFDKPFNGHQPGYWYCTEFSVYQKGNSFSRFRATGEYHSDWTLFYHPDVHYNFTFVIQRLVGDQLSGII